MTVRTVLYCTAHLSSPHNPSKRPSRTRVQTSKTSGQRKYKKHANKKKFKISSHFVPSSVRMHRGKIEKKSRKCPAQLKLRDDWTLTSESGFRDFSLWNLIN